MAIEIIHYNSKYYDEVITIFQDRKIQQVWHGLKNAWKSPKIIAYFLLSILLAPISLEFSFSYLISLFSIHAYSVFQIFYGYGQTHMKTDMKDKNLTFWTTEPNAYLLALVDNQVVGMVAFQHIDSQVAELNRMTVLQNYRRLGIARQLTEKCLEMLKNRGYQKVVLTTTNLNFEAHWFYTKMGFQHTRNLKFGSVLSDYFSGVYILEYVLEF